MSSWLLIIFVMSSSITFAGFPSTFSKCFFPQLYSFFLTGSFQVSSHSTLPSAHLVYCPPCNPSFSIFNWISNLIFLIWMYSVCSLYVSSFCSRRNPTNINAKKRYWLGSFGSIGMWFLRLHALFLTVNVSHGTRFSSLFSLSGFCCRFYLDIDEVFIFVIQRKRFWYLVKYILSVNVYLSS